jgi:hypothetical protein
MLLKALTCCQFLLPLPIGSPLPISFANWLARRPLSVANCLLVIAHWLANCPIDFNVLLTFLSFANCLLRIWLFLLVCRSLIAYCQLSIDSIIFAPALKIVAQKNKE